MPKVYHYCNNHTKIPETQGFAAYTVKVVNSGLLAVATMLLGVLVVGPLCR